MLQFLRERLVLILLTLLPFHALLVTVGTQMLHGPGNPPMAMLAMWKELLLGVVLSIAFAEIVSQQWKMDKGKKTATCLRFDPIDWLIIALIALAFIVSYYQFSILHSPFFYGFKYDFVPLIAFIVLRRVEWSEIFVTCVLQVLVIVGALVAGYGILTFLLPMKFFVWLGYSPLHSLYIPDGSLAAFQQISDSGIRRIQSTMSGANQFGLWLLIPLSALLAFRVQKKPFSIVHFPLSILLVLALLLTFSRSAVLAAGVIIGIVLWQELPRKRFWHILAVATVSAVFAILLTKPFISDIVVRTASTRGHLDRPIAALQMIRKNPLGYGLGAAGPASNRVSDACVYLGEDEDASWAADRTDLCVFQGDVQLQPTDRQCRCPVLPENWYLQIGVELGVLGMTLFLILIILIIRSLRPSPYALLPFLAVSIAALFLHAWEDSAVAYTIWILAAMALVHPKKVR